MSYVIESYGNGFIVSDISGNRGDFGAAYCGKNGVWRSQPIGLGEVFPTKESAEQFIKSIE